MTWRTPVRSGRAGAIELALVAAVAMLGGCETRILGGDTIATVGTGGTGGLQVSNMGGGAGGVGGLRDGGADDRPRDGAADAAATDGGMFPSFDTDASAADPPPPVSGGTLIVLADGQTAVASDPDRDLIAVTKLASPTLAAVIALETHDEPGRLVEDAAGRVHVVLRRGGALVTINPADGAILERRAVCPIPRGVAYDPATDLVHVACMGGELISLPAAGGAATRTLQLAGDLRDVVVDGDTLIVSQFRSANALIVDASGNVTATIGPPNYATATARNGATFSPSTAWRLRPGPNGGAVMLHQRGVVGQLALDGVADIDGSGDPCASAVQTALTPITPGAMPPATPPVPGMVLPVDFALSADGSTVAIVAAGNAHNTEFPTLFLSAYATLTDATFGACCVDDLHGPLPRFLSAATRVVCTAMTSATSEPIETGQPTGEPVAVAFDGQGRVVVQTREPATIQVPDTGITIELSAVSRADLGHEIFHTNTGAGVACASCHPEGQEDGRTWTFAAVGARRTMTVAGGVGARTPYDWGGEIPTLTDLAATVYSGQMQGPMLTSNRTGALAEWMNAIPRLPGVVTDAAAVARGQALFTSTALACANCHSGAQLTNGGIDVDEETGARLKVPSLVGLAFTAPYMHDGCATTLGVLVDPACSGAQHALTSTLTPDQLSDLVAYLDSL